MMGVVFSLWQLVSVGFGFWGVPLYVLYGTWIWCSRLAAAHTSAHTADGRYVEVQYYSTYVARGERAGRRGPTGTGTTDQNGSEQPIRAGLRPGYPSTMIGLLREADREAGCACRVSGVGGKRKTTATTHPAAQRERESCSNQTSDMGCQKPMYVAMATDEKRYPILLCPAEIHPGRILADILAYPTLERASTGK